MPTGSGDDALPLPPPGRAPSPPPLPPPPPGGAPPPPPAGPPDETAGGGRNWKKIALITGAVLVALMIIGALTSPDEATDEVATGKGTTTTATTAKPTTSQAAATTKATTTTKPKATTTTVAPTTSRPTPTTTGAPALPEGCVAVTGPVGDTIGGGEITGAAEAPPSPYGEQRPRWYYSTANGATWVSQIPPDGSTGGLTLPINDAARAASEVGVDVPQDAPAYDGIGDAFPAAAKSRDCALG